MKKELEKLTKEQLLELVEHFEHYPSVTEEDDRAYILASLESVDYVVIFDEDTPYELIKLIKPHTLVKGGDYEGKDVVGQDIVKELNLVNFVDGKSTTNTIKRIQNSETNN